MNTFILWIVNFIPQILLAFVLAYWFTNRRLNLKGTGFFKSLFYLPNIITAASVALIFRSLFSYPRGPINLITMDWNLISTPVDYLPRCVLCTTDRIIRYSSGCGMARRPSSCRQVF
ncbi:MAG: hypothetical protein U5K84_04150 [Alkalibacterium sp.]|nr:hypothetical protein [Alkalibacterium sp.]